MRRDYYIDNDIPDDCIFFAPLSEGDLTDHISGVTGTTLGSCGYTWDIDEKAYLFDNVRGRANSAALKFSLPNYLSPAISASEMTMLVEVKGINNLNVYAQWTGRIYGTIGDYTCLQLDSDQFGTQSLNRWYKLAVVCQGAGRKFYKDGILTLNSPSGFDFSTRYKSDLYVLPSLSTGGTPWGNGQAYVRNVWRFSRALSLSEIKNIQRIL